MRMRMVNMLTGLDEVGVMSRCRKSPCESKKCKIRQKDHKCL